MPAVRFLFLTVCLLFLVSSVSGPALFTSCLARRLALMLAVRFLFLTFCLLLSTESLLDRFCSLSIRDAAPYEGTGKATHLLLLRARREVEVVAVLLDDVTHFFQGHTLDVQQLANLIC